MTSNQDFQLIDGSVLKQKLEVLIPQASRELVFISAYVTDSAIDWLLGLVPPQLRVSVVCRLTPLDVASGASSLTALLKAVNVGWRVSCLHALHAKVYSIDSSKIYAGSANLTGNGLKIFGTGNIEACLEVAATADNLQFIESIKRSATPLSGTALSQMSDFISKEIASDQAAAWPPEILPYNESLWVVDTFWSDPRSNDRTPERDHDLAMIGVDCFALSNAELSRHLSSTRIVRWLTSKLKHSHNNELYFGSLSSALQNDLRDDPVPYRSSIKYLVQNLISYCDLFLKDEFIIDRPNYSQRIRLR